MKKNKNSNSNTFKDLKHEMSFTSPHRVALNLDDRVSNTLSSRTNFKDLFYRRLLISPADVVKRSPSRFFDKLYFNNVFSSPICKVRADRRRSLFASGVAGKIKVKKAHWSEWSKISC